MQAAPGLSVAAAKAPVQAAPPSTNTVPKAASSKAVWGTLPSAKRRSRAIDLFGRGSPFQDVTLLLQGMRPDRLKMMQKIYGRIFSEVIHMFWMDIEKVPHSVTRHSEILLFRERDGSFQGRSEEEQHAEVVQAADLVASHMNGTLGRVTLAPGAAEAWNRSAAQAWDRSAAQASNRTAEQAAAMARRAKVAASIAEATSEAGKTPLKGMSSSELPTSYVCPQRDRIVYHSTCLVRVIHHIVGRRRASRGLLVAHADFWFHPYRLLSSTGLRLTELWQLSGGLKVERGFGGNVTWPHCHTRVEDLEQDRSWHYGTSSFDVPRKYIWRSIDDAHQALRRLGQQVDIPTTVCAGWADMYYLPRKVWPKLMKLVPYTKQISHEIALPSLFHLMENSWNVKRKWLPDCWGGCCVPGTVNKQTIKDNICGHRMALEDRSFRIAFNWTISRDLKELDGRREAFARSTLRRLRGEEVPEEADGEDEETEEDRRAYAELEQEAEAALEEERALAPAPPPPLEAEAEPEAEPEEAEPEADPED